MDPANYYLDWDRTFEVLGTIVVISLILERALSIIFEHRKFVERFRDRGIKEIIAFALAFLVCLAWDFDAISMILPVASHTSMIGKIITAGVIAGGSKGSIKLFRDVLGFRSRAYDEDETKRLAAESAKKKKAK